MEQQEITKISKSVMLTPEIVTKLEKLAAGRDRSVHYIMVEIIEKNVDNPVHLTEQARTA